MTGACPECGAPVAAAGSCLDLFHALLLLEGDVPGAPGSILHFYAVAAYALQHPDGMNYRADVLAGLRVSVADALDGRADLAELRRRARAFDGPARVVRRPGDEAVPWRRGGWPMTVVDVINGGVDSYPDLVTRWAASVRETLDADAG